MELNLSLHPGQLAVFQNRARFKVVAAGRRWGKTRLAAVELLTKTLEETCWVNRHRRSLAGIECWYIAPTYDQAKDIVWGTLKDLAGELVTKTWENDGKMQLANGRCIQIKGSDRPDRLRGVGLSHVVLDEYASMKPQTWDSILRPTLADVSGSATFIGTPAGKNHFYDLFKQAALKRGWSAFHFLSTENPFLPTEEIEAAREGMPREVFLQEFEASWEQGNQLIFPYDLIQVAESEVPRDCINYIAMDPAGFATEHQARQRNTRLDETAIAVVGVSREGWYVRDVIAGRWDVRETSIRLLRACQQYRPVAVAIEKGMARNAIMPYLNDQMRRLQIYPNLIEVSHGGQNKTSRITWALQGRLEHGRIRFVSGEYFRALSEQIWDFPFGRHDDMVDALAYIDQVAQIVYREDWIEDTWEPLDEAVGL